MTSSSTSTSPPPPSSKSSASLRFLYEGVAIAVLAATLGYVLHHLPPLREHAVEGVVLGLAAAAATAIALGRLVRERVTYELPAVLVARPGGPDVRSLTSADLDFCAALHAQALPHGFFAELGGRFLRAYYATFLDSPHAVAFGATVSRQPVGYLVGMTDPRAHTRWVLRRRGAKLAFFGAVGVARNPRAGYRFLRTRLARYARAWRRHRGSANGNANEQRGVGRVPAVLTHVAVLEGARGLAAGRRLVDAFLDAARERGASSALLTTLAGPGGAGGFYARAGWMLSTTRTSPDGERIEEWVRSLNERSEK